MFGVACIQSTNEVPQPVQIAKSNLADQQQITNPKTGKTERVYVNLEAVYPNPDDPTEEFSFEELRAKFRGWTDRDWTTDRRRENLHESRTQENTRRLLSPEESKINVVTTDGKQQAMSSQDTTEHIVDSVPIDDVTQGTKARKSRRTKVMEVRAETQTSTSLRLTILHIEIANVFYSKNELGISYRP